MTRAEVSCKGCKERYENAMKSVLDTGSGKSYGKKKKNGTDRKMLLYLMDTAVVGRLLRVQRK